MGDLKIKLREEINTERLREKFFELYSIGFVEEDIEKGKFIRTNTVFDELFDNIKNNLWLEYFFNNPMYQRENWIDLESEISNVIQSMDKVAEVVHGSTMTTIDVKHRRIFCDMFSGYQDKLKLISSDEEFGKCVSELIADLNRFTRALEIYFCEYVGSMKVIKCSPDISGLEIHRVISFNYTKTYLKLYKIVKKKDESEKNYLILFLVKLIYKIP